MKRIGALVLAVSLSSIVLLGCLGGTSQGSPYDSILDAQEIPGDWEMTYQETNFITWDRQGGYREIFRSFEWSNSTLEIEIIIYGISSRSERTFPLYEPPSGVVPTSVNVGDEGIYWSLMPDSQYIHFKEGGALAYSSLSNPDHPELDKNWFIDVMRLQALKV